MGPTTTTPILVIILTFDKGEKKMVLLVIMLVLFFRPVLRAVGLINEALNAGLDKAETKLKTEDK